jgi:Flp pilus assembly protein TadD
VAVAYSNLGSVCLEEKDNACAEAMYREAVRRLDATSANSLNDAVAHSKLGRALLREGRLDEAEREALVGYTYLAKHVTAGDRFLALARKDLAAIYDALHRADEAARYRAELELAAKQ